MEAGGLRGRAVIVFGSAERPTRATKPAQPTRAPGRRRFVSTTTAKPLVLVIYRLDHEFLLDVVIGQVRQRDTSYDFVLASQPWRARMDAAFKVENVLAR